MSKVIYSWANPRPRPEKQVSPPSVTVPDQSMSVRTLMDRYRRGMPLDTHAKTPLYLNGEFPDVQGLDLVEIQQLRKQADAQVKKYKEDLQKQEEQKRTAKELAIQNKIRDLEDQLKASGLAARGKVEGEARTNPIS